MKNLLLFAFCILLFKSINAQVPTAMPPDATAFYNKAMPVIRQHIKDIVVQAAHAIKRYNANADSLSRRLRANHVTKGMSNHNIDGITVLILVQASRDADADLKLMVLGMSRRNEQQQATAQSVSVNNAKNENRSTDEINDIQNLKLQVIIERKRRMAEEIGSVMQKIQNTQQSIINDLK